MFDGGVQDEGGGQIGEGIAIFRFLFPVRTKILRFIQSRNGQGISLSDAVIPLRTYGKK